jgi:hypothetical protein
VEQNIIRLNIDYCRVGGTDDGVYSTAGLISGEVSGGRVAGSDGEGDVAYCGSLV